MSQTWASKRCKQIGIDARKQNLAKYNCPVEMTRTSAAWWKLGWEEENERQIDGKPHPLKSLEILILQDSPGFINGFDSASYQKRVLSFIGQVKKEYSVE